MNEKQVRHEKSLVTVSGKAKDGWYSRRVHGELQPNRHNNATFVNRRDKIGRNRRVSIAGAPIKKFKKTDLYASAIPVEAF